MAYMTASDQVSTLNLGGQAPQRATSPSEWPDGHFCRARLGIFGTNSWSSCEYDSSVQKKKRSN